MRYNTKQRQEVLELIYEFKEQHISAEMLLEEINKRGLKISRATLYRVLDLLVEEGILTKMFIENKMSACYQLCNSNNHHHFHLVCNKCGKLIHLDCDEVDNLINHIADEHDFSVDASRVVLYGLCNNCRGK